MVVSVQIAPPDFDRMFGALADHTRRRSEEHTSELQSQSNLVCRLLLEKKKKYPQPRMTWNYTHVSLQVSKHLYPDYDLTVTERSALYDHSLHPSVICPTSLESLQHLVP